MSERKRNNPISPVTGAQGASQPKKPPSLVEIRYDRRISWLVGSLPDGSLCVPLTPFDRGVRVLGALPAIEIPYLTPDIPIFPAMLLRPDSTEFRYFLWHVGRDLLTELPPDVVDRKAIPRKRAVVWMRGIRTRLTALGHAPPDLCEMEDTMRCYAASLDYPAWVDEAILVHIADQHAVSAEA